MKTVPEAKRDCPYVGPWVVSRGVRIGQFCWHPDNLNQEKRIHLNSQSCAEWAQCPRLKDQLLSAMH